MLICKKGVLEGNIFTDEKGIKYVICNLFSPDASNCYIQLENSKISEVWICTRKINIMDTKL